MNNGSVAEAVPINDQPVAATFFGEGRWLTQFITPNAQEIQELHDKLTEGMSDTVEKLTALWKWVASEVKYVKFVKGKVWISNKVSVQNDLWLDPTSSLHVMRGNCATKSFLLCSLIRNTLNEDQVYCTLGNLYNGISGGHAWITCILDGVEYTMESTVPVVPPLVPSRVTERYEAVHYFNDKRVMAIEGRTQLIPYAEVYSTWLSDYLNWAYIKGGNG